MKNKLLGALAIAVEKVVHKMTSVKYEEIVDEEYYQYYD